MVMLCSPRRIVASDTEELHSHTLPSVLAPQILCLLLLQDKPPARDFQIVEFLYDEPARKRGIVFLSEVTDPLILVKRCHVDVFLAHANEVAVWFCGGDLVDYEVGGQGQGCWENQGEVTVSLCSVGEDGERRRGECMGHKEAHYVLWDYCRPMDRWSCLCFYRAVALLLWRILPGLP